MKLSPRKSLLVAAISAALAIPGATLAASHDHGGHAGHGGKSEHHGSADDMDTMMRDMHSGLSDTSAFGGPGQASKVTRTVTVEAADIMFDTDELSFKVGETVRFVVANTGELPHEFTIGDATYQQEARRMMAHMAGMGTDMSSPEHAAQHAAAGNTVTVDPGETAEVIWTFSEAGDFEFACNIPGHSEAGMKGRIVVE